MGKREEIIKLGIDIAKNTVPTQYSGLNADEALRNGFKELMGVSKDGVIDAIVSQHTPHEIEFKNVEFHIAKNGITGLQTALPLAVKADLSAELIVEKLATAPRRILGLEIPKFDKGELANLVVFDMNAKWVFDSKSNKSKGANNPLMGQELKGKVNVVINNNKMITN